MEKIFNNWCSQSLFVHTFKIVKNWYFHSFFSAITLQKNYSNELMFLQLIRIDKT